MLKPQTPRWPAVVAVPTLIVAAFCVAPTASAASGFVVSTAIVQKAIAAAHAGWKAKDSWVTHLSQDQIKRILGVSNAPDTSLQFSAPETLKVDALGRVRAPQTLDWRNNQGVDWVSPILNQGNCGSCVAYATVGTLETQVNITAGIPGLNPSFSTQALFACGGGACDFGWQPNLAAEYLQSTGVPDEACSPNTEAATGEDISCDTICSDAPSRSLKIVSYSEPTSGTTNVAAVKKALAHGPLITTMTVYSDFLTYGSGVYKHVTGTGLGGHAIGIVGFDDATRSWIIRNSWGSDWGEGGFAHVSWDDISGISDETWSLQVPSPQGYVTVRNPHGRAFLSGAVELDAESTFPGTSAIDLVVLNDGGAQAQKLSCSATPCHVNLNTRGLGDGHYEIYAVAHTTAGAQSSEHEQFFAYNGTPKLSLSFSPKEVDLTKPVTDRIEFNVSSSTGESQVPLTSLTFHVAQNGKEVQARSTQIVLNQMVTGWRTNTVPNGRYEIWYSGQLATADGVKATVESQHVQVTTSN